MLNVNIQITSYEQGERLLRAVFGADVTATAPEVLGGQPAEKKPAKARPAAAPAPAPATTEKVVEQPGEPALTLEVVRGKAQELSIAGKKADVKKLLSTVFGVEKVAELAADQYHSFYAEMQKL